MAETNAVNHKTIGKLFSNEIGYIELKYDIGGGDSGAAADSVVLGKFSGKSIIHSCIPHVQTAFTDAGGTGTLDVGIKGGDVDAFIDAGTGAAAATLVDDYTVQETGNVPMVVAADTEILADPAVEALTAGTIVLKITYSNAI